jgi:choline dehydrogenase-like flavoprotein
VKKSYQLKEPPMVWYAKQEHYILSPYFDILSHWFHSPWRKVPINDRVGLMAKLADTPNGIVTEDGKVHKDLPDIDLERLKEAMSIAKNIMEAAGVKGPFVEGLANGGHLGGTVPLSRNDVPMMRPSWLPKGLWVADLSLVPMSQGLPTMLTTMAIALRVARRIAEESDVNQ